jgi:hypothetical protein
MARPEGEAGASNRNLSAPQAAKLMKQKMSGGYEWRREFRFVKRRLLSSLYFTVTFGPDGRVKDITDVSTDDLSSHRA